MAKDTDSISSGSDDSGAHVKNIDDKIKTSTSASPSKSLELSNIAGKASNLTTASAMTSAATTATIKKPPRKSRLPEPVTHFAQMSGALSARNSLTNVDSNDYLSQEESFQSPTRRYKKNTEVAQVKRILFGIKALLCLLHVLYLFYLY